MQINIHVIRALGLRDPFWMTEAGSAIIFREGSNWSSGTFFA